MCLLLHLDLTRVWVSVEKQEAVKSFVVFPKKTGKSTLQRKRHSAGAYLTPTRARDSLFS